MIRCGVFYRDDIIMQITTIKYVIEIKFWWDNKKSDIHNDWSKQSTTKTRERYKNFIIQKAL